MKKLISAELSGKIMIAVFLLLIILHILVLAGVVPSNIVWAGMGTDSYGDLIALESISIASLILFILIVLLKLRPVESDNLRKLISVGVWFIFIFFIVNTLGNLSSEVYLEKIIFTPVTIILALLSLRLAIEKTIT